MVSVIKVRLCRLVKLLLEEREISRGVLSWDLVGMGSAGIVLRAHLSALQHLLQLTVVGCQKQVWVVNSDQCYKRAGAWHH